MDEDLDMEVSMTLLGRIAAIHIMNATPGSRRKKPHLWPLLLILALLLVLLGKLT